MPADRPLKREVEWLTDAAYDRGVRDGIEKERDRLRELVAAVETNYVGQEGPELSMDEMFPLLKARDDFWALASPDRILGLLDENRELRAALERLQRAVTQYQVEIAHAPGNYSEKAAVAALYELMAAIKEARAALEGKRVAALATRDEPAPSSEKGAAVQGEEPK